MSRKGSISMSPSQCCGPAPRPACLVVLAGLIWLLLLLLLVLNFIHSDMNPPLLVTSPLVTNHALALISCQCNCLLTMEGSRPADS